jgi:hypothetical protein
VKTIVRRRPMRPARRRAAWKECPCRIPIAKKMIARVWGEASYLRVEPLGDEGLWDEAAAEAVEREQGRRLAS